MSRSGSGKRWGTALATAVALVVGGLGVQPASAAPAAPRSLSPASVSVSANPVLQWARVRGASSYAVEVSASSSFSTVLYKATTANHRLVPTAQLPAGTVWWRVRGIGASGTGPWATSSFSRSSIAGPTLLSPASGTTLVQPSQAALLSWTPVNGATSYQVEIDDATDFVGAKSYTTKTSSLVVPDPQSAADYYWHVRAQIGSGLSTLWSETRRYTIGGLSPAELVQPLDSPSTFVDNVVLEWKPVAGAKDYELRVSTDQDFNTYVQKPIVVKGTRFSPPVTYSNDQYYWQVRPRDVYGNALAWGQHAWQFRRAWPGQPQLEYPADKSVVGDPFFYQWTPVRLASSYTIQLSTTSDFAVIADSCTTVHTTYIPTKGGDCWPGSNGTYFWRVVATDAPGRTPNGDPIVTDTIAAQQSSFTYRPELVTLLSPENGATVDVPTLSWEPVAGAAEYKVTITPIDGGSGGGTKTTAALSYTPRTKLTPGKSYRWSVQTVSQSGRFGSAPLIGGQPVFTVGPDPASTATATAPEQTGPADGSTSARFPMLTWTPVANATSYKVWTSPAGMNSFTQITGTFPYPAGADEGSDRLAAGSYDWYVEAYNGSSWLGGSTNLSTFEIAPLPAVTGQHAALAGTALDSPSTSCVAPLPDKCAQLRQTPVLGWDAQPNAGYYKLYLARDKEMTDRILNGVVVESNRWMSNSALIDSQAGDAFYWYVQPCKVDAACSALQHATNAFDKRSNPVQLLGPAEGTTQRDDVTFSWRDYLDTNYDAPTADQLDSTGVPARIEAKQYRIQVSSDPNFNTGSGIFNETAVVDQTTYTAYSQTYPEGPLYWRVQAIDGSGNALTWSPVWSFLKQSPKPSLSSPSARGTVSSTQPFSWSPLNFAASYDVEVYANGDVTGSSANRVASGNSKQVAFTLTSPLPASSTPYTWRVRRVDASGRKGGWSAFSSFTVSGSAPQLVAPASSAYVPGRDAIFSWKAVNGAAAYRFERRLAGATSLAEAVTTASLAWAPTKTVTDGSWVWRVTALDAAGKPLGTSAWRGFKVDSVRPKIVRKSPVRTALRTANFVAKMSERVRHADSTTVKLYVKGQAKNLRARVTVSRDGRTVTLNPKLNLRAGKVYTVRFSSRITDVAGNHLAATAWSAKAK